MTVTVFGNLILISIIITKFFILFFSVFIFWHLEVRQKYSALPRVFNFLGIWKCGTTQSVVFVMLQPKQKWCNSNQACTIVQNNNNKKITSSTCVEISLS